MNKEELEKRVPKYLEPFIEEYSDDHTVKVACSLSNMNKEMQETIEMIKPLEMVRLGGAGNKVNRIALNEVDSYV